MQIDNPLVGLSVICYLSECVEFLGGEYISVYLNLKSQVCGFRLSWSMTSQVTGDLRSELLQFPVPSAAS